MKNDQNCNAGSPKIILASASVIRAQIMSNAGITFETNPTNINEDTIKQKFIHESRSTVDLVKELANQKAKAALPSTNELIIGADQILEFEGQVFDKPKTMDEARERLKLLRGHEHRLIGAVCIVQLNQKIWHHTSITKLKMRSFSDDFLNDYLNEEGDSVLASVGAYKFEGLGASLFESVEGDFFSILGLSLLPLMAELRNRGALLT